MECEESNKLDALLRRFAQSNWGGIDDEKTQRFVNYIRKQEISSPTHRSQRYLGWIGGMVENWQTSRPEEKHLTLTLDLIGILIGHKQCFIMMHTEQMIQHTLEAVRQLSCCSTESVNTSYLKLLQGFTHIGLGKEWLIGNLGSWSNVFDMNHKYNSVSFTDSLAQFLADLYLNVVPLNEQFFVDLCHILLKPFYDVSTKVNTCLMVCQSETDLYQEVSPTLRLLNALFMCLTAKIDKFSQWRRLYSKLFSFQKLLYTLLKNITDEQFSFELSQVIIPIHLLEIGEYVLKDPIDFREKFIRHLIKSLQINNSRLFLNNILLLAKSAQMFWGHLYKILDLNKHNWSFCLQRDFLMIQMMPFIELDMRILGREALNKCEDSESREAYIDDCCAQMEQNMVHLWYKMREALNPQSCILKEAIQSIEYLQQTNDFLSRYNGILLVKFCSYFIEDIVESVNKAGNLKNLKFDNEFVKYFLDFFINSVEDLSICWKDGIELVLILTRVMEFLQLSDLTDDLVVRALKLVEISVSRYLSPNLALLVDSDDPSVNYLGPLLYTKIRDTNASIRYGCLRIFHTLAENAQNKYPYFKRTIMVSELHKITVKILFSKDNSQNRAYAAKCLQKIILVPELWQDLLNTPNMLTSLVNLLKVECDDTVKAEIVTSIAVIFEEDHFDQSSEKEIFHTMVTSGMFNKNTNVRVNVLQFWEKVVQKLLYIEGMIDGGFPEYTFSKEHRKIIYLDCPEVVKRIKKVLNQLSELGYLSLLLQLNKTEHEEEKTVVEEHVHNLKTLLDKYDVNLETLECQTPNVSMQNSENVFIFDDTTAYVSPVEFFKKIDEPEADYFPLEYKNEFVTLLDDLLAC